MCRYGSLFCHVLNAVFEDCQMLQILKRPEQTSFLKSATGSFYSCHLLWFLVTKVTLGLNFQEMKRPHIKLVPLPHRPKLLHYNK